MVWLLPAVMAGMGALQGQKAQEQEKRDRELQAATAAFSPWTGMAPQSVRPREGMMEGAAGGFMSGLGQNQKMQEAGMQNKLMGAKINYYNRMGGGSAMGQPMGQSNPLEDEENARQGYFPWGSR